MPTTSGRILSSLSFPLMLRPRFESDEANPANVTFWPWCLAHDETHGHLIIHGLCCFEF